MKSTNMLERLNEEIKRRTREVRIFPNAESCLRLVRALCVETHEAWLEDSRYLNMSLLAEQKKELLRAAAWAASETTSTMATFFAQLDGHNPALTPGRRPFRIAESRFARPDGQAHRTTSSIACRVFAGCGLTR
jgi:hypothetical protein